MNRKTFLIVALIFSTKLLIAQTEFRPGFIITNKNDTIYGEIDFRNDKFMSEKCRFKNDNGDITVFTPDELSGYRILNSKYLVSRTINGQLTFLEFLISGQINIYYKYDLSGSHYYLEKAGSEIIEMPYREEIFEKDGLQYLTKSKDHIGLLAYYMRDAPKMQSEIYRIDKPNHSNLINLAEDYHNAVCKDQKCIIYEKKMRPVKLEIEVQGGIVKLTKAGTKNRFDYDHIKNQYYQSGIIFHISSSMISEKYMLKTGLQYSKYKGSDSYGTIENIDIINIPLGIEYLYPRGAIRPDFEAGVNIYHIPDNDFFAFSFGAGLNIKIINPVSLTVTYNMEILPNFLLGQGPVQIDRHSISAGLRFKF